MLKKIGIYLTIIFFNDFCLSIFSKTATFKSFGILFKLINLLDTLKMNLFSSLWVTIYPNGVLIKLYSLSLHVIECFVVFISLSIAPKHSSSKLSKCSLSN